MEEKSVILITQANRKLSSAWNTMRIVRLSSPNNGRVLSPLYRIALSKPISLFAAGDSVRTRHLNDCTVISFPNALNTEFLCALFGCRRRIAHCFCHCAHKNGLSSDKLLMTRCLVMCLSCACSSPPPGTGSWGKFVTPTTTEKTQNNSTSHCWFCHWAAVVVVNQATPGWCGNELCTLLKLSALCLCARWPQSPYLPAQCLQVFSCPCQVMSGIQVSTGV